MLPPILRAGAVDSQDILGVRESDSYFESVAVDATGNQIIADTGQGALLKVESNGPANHCDFQRQ